VIQLESVGKTYGGRRGDVEAVRDVNLSLRQGSITAIVGPSGCGKSTLLHMIAGLYQPTAGQIVASGKVVRALNTSVGYMTQKDNLFPWLSVRDNVALPLEFAGVSKAERSRRAGEVLQRVGLTGFEDRYPSELSGGMRKRTALARMLIHETKTFLLDEPFGALDPQLKLAMQALLLDLWREGGQTIAFVTHDLIEAITLADRVVVVTKRPARIALELEIDLSYPRDVADLRFTERFKTFYDTLWERLRLEYEEAVL
jgi:NitT/TauT family transport system ATP-binding protein